MMEFSKELAIIFFLSYMIGSISPSLIIGKWFYKIDIRDHGSNNLGGSNAGRLFGSKIGIIVIILDFLKGFVAVWIASNITNNSDYILLSGLVVVLGHIFPMFANFRGGKGVATTGGVLLFLKPILIPIILTLILVFWLITKYESLSTLGAATYLLVLIVMNHTIFINIMAIFVYFGIFYAHRRNIYAIINKTEKQKNIFSKFK